MDFAIKVLSIFIKYPLAYKNTCLYNVVKRMSEMARKIVKFTPDQLGYKDRGKMKWQGLILSDHTEAVQSMFKSDSVHPEPKNVMSVVDISEVLLQAYIKKVPVNIQSNILQNGHYRPDINCIVRGVADNRIVLELKTGAKSVCLIEEIRNVEFADVSEWYEK